MIFSNLSWRAQNQSHEPIWADCSICHIPTVRSDLSQSRLREKQPPRFQPTSSNSRKPVSEKGLHQGQIGFLFRVGWVRGAKLVLANQGSVVGNAEMLERGRFFGGWSINSRVSRGLSSGITDCCDLVNPRIPSFYLTCSHSCCWSSWYTILRRSN